MEELPLAAVVPGDKLQQNNTFIILHSTAVQLFTVECVGCSRLGLYCVCAGASGTKNTHKQRPGDHILCTI